MKKLIPKSWQTATITQSYIRFIKGSKRLVICFTIDSGEYSYNNILKEYPLNEWGLTQLSNHFAEIDFNVFNDTESVLFYKQFHGLRMELHVDRDKIADGIINIILEMRQTTKERDYNVLAPKEEEHYHKNNKGRDLPIWSKDGEIIKTKQFSR